MRADEQTTVRGPADTLVRAGRIYSMGARPVHDTHQLLRPDHPDWLNNAH